MTNRDWLRVECIPPPAARPPYESGTIYVQRDCGDGGLLKRGFLAFGKPVHHMQRVWRGFVRVAR